MGECQKSLRRVFMNSLEDILGINFAEVLKQTVDFNH